MAWYLYWLGRWAYRSRRLVASVWVVVLLAAGVGAATLSGPTDDSFALPGLESTRAFDLIKERTPGAAPDGAQARIVFQAPEGQRLDDTANRAAVTASLDAVKGDDVLQVSDPFTSGAVSEDGRTGYATVQYAVSSMELDEADKTALEEAPDAARDAGLTVAIGGDATQENEIGHTSELIGLVVALVVLVLTFGSMLVAGMPLLTAIVGVGIGVAGITAATGFMDLGQSTPILASMLGLAVGIDYALFIVSRFRHEVAQGHDLEHAAGRAVGTAGSAVVFAGLTVIAALGGLAIVNISFLTEMGVAAALTVAVAVLIALTLLPAIFGFAGRRIVDNRLPFLSARDPEDAGGRRTNGRRWADLVTRHKGVTFVVGLAAAAVVAIPVASMELALPDDGGKPAGTGPRVAYDLIADNFGPGANGPLLVVVDTAQSADPEAAVADAVRAVETVKDDVAAVISPLPTAQTPPEVAQAFEQQLAEGRYATITVMPESGPSEAATKELVHDIRTALDGLEDGTGAEALVTGMTALGVDVSDSLADAFPTYLAVVVGFAFVLLMIVFRSILVPLKAVLGFLVSVGVALGATVAVFQWGWLIELVGVDREAPILFMLPLLLTGILFGLAMDYEVFLVSRMREEYTHGTPAVQSVVRGFTHGARVVTAAAVIMIGVFVAFATLDDPVIKSIGFGLAVGIVADAFLVRMTLVPAFMALVGDRMWWLPSWLDRALPVLDIEGESLAIIDTVRERLAAEDAGHAGDAGPASDDETLVPTPA